MFKYTKLKRSQINKLLNCFILGLPALQTARYTGIHRNTINKFFKRIRLKIVKETTKNDKLLKVILNLMRHTLEDEKREKEAEEVVIKRLFLEYLNAAEK